MEEWKPNLFVPGFPKCGTSALAEYLSQHPDVYVIESKEPSTLYHWKIKPKFMVPDPSKLGKPIPFESYKKSYEKNKDKKYRVDASQPYSFDVNFLEELKKFNKEAKIIIMIRDPIKRLISAYTFTYLFHRKEFREWIDYISDELEYLLYYPYVKKAVELFGKEKVLLIEQEDLMKDPQRVMNCVFRFLGVRPIKIKPLVSNPSPISLNESKLLRDVKAALMLFVAILIKPLTCLLDVLGLRKTMFYVWLRKYHPISLIQKMLAFLKPKKPTTVEIPKHIEKILIEDYVKIKELSKSLKINKCKEQI